MKKSLLIIDIVVLLILIKVIWVSMAMSGYGDMGTEKEDILKRRDWLLDKVCVTPMDLLNEMPRDIGLQYQGEWALYSCSMLTKALCNVAKIYRETRIDALARVDSLISIVMSPELRTYDIIRWNEDPLDSLEGNNSHISYLSHLAWMIGNYKMIGGDTKYDETYHQICDAMNRRILDSPIMNLSTYPDEPIYIPDMLVAIVALHENGRFETTVRTWMRKAKAEWIDSDTGLLKSFLEEDLPLKGSYSALNCYYLSLIDEVFAYRQFKLLKKWFYCDGILPGIKEYTNRSPIIEFDIDAGLIIYGLSPGATAFAIGPATYYNDSTMRLDLLRTAEIGGHSLKRGNRRHYALSDFALVGEAITLAMRTHVKR